MQQAWVVPAALALGLLVGAGITIVLVMSYRRGRQAVAVATPGVPDGVGEVIDALESVGIVLDPSNNVISASTSAIALGLVWNQSLVQAELVELVDRVRRDGIAVSQEMHLARGPFGDANVHVLVRAARLGTRYVLLLAEDRTEAFRLEGMRRDFVANVSHELKTPIGAISLLAEALQSAADEPVEVKRFAQRLEIESERLARITQELIQLSRLQASDSLEHPEWVSLDSVLSQATDRSRVAADAHRLTLVVGGAKGVKVFGDEQLLVTAVHNLVVNAVQYSPDGARVGVGVTRVARGVEIAVTDQGVGIPDVERDRVFERFYRVDSARSRQTGGTGLGLSIVKHIAQNHGGDVRVWSHPGSGSTFTIRLPDAESPALVRPGGTA